MTKNNHLAGVVLAGGQSRRMGGGDKSLLMLAGKPLLAHVIDRLRPQVGSIAINANGDAARFAAFNLPVITDTIDGFAGPLAGVLAGLRWAQEHARGSRYVVTAASDTPFFPAGLPGLLRNAATSRDDTIVLASSNGRLHPVFGLWPCALADDLELWLKNGDNRKVLAWVDRHRLVEVPFPPIEYDDYEVDPFFNANTPEELEQAEDIARHIF